MKTPTRIRLAAAMIAACAAASLAHAQTPPAGTPERLRGTLVSKDGDTLVLHGLQGDETVRMADGWTVGSTRPATLAAITPGMAIGVVSRGPAAHPVVAAIQVFAPEAPQRPGQRPWDMMPESTMTNAVVAGEVSATTEGGLSLKYDDKVVSMTVPPDVSVGVAGPGDKTMLVPGVHLVVFSTGGPGGSHTGRIAIVGLDGSTPPL